MATYDEVRVVRNTEGPWPYTAYGYDRDPADGELVQTGAEDGDTPDEARAELARQRKQP